ncbi:MAG: MBL fold metallo-hydrolase, partial [Planctomycetota bacterium]
YVLEDFEPLKKSGVLKRIRGKRMIAEGVELMLTGAHSPGHMIVRIQNGEDALLCPCESPPDRHHTRLAWTMAYDAVPGMVVEVKRTLLSAAAEQGMTVFLSHEMGPAFGTLTVKEGGKEFVYKPL